MVHFFILLEALIFISVFHWSMIKDIILSLKMSLIFSIVIKFRLQASLPFFSNLNLQSRKHLFFAHFLPKFLLLLRFDTDIQLIIRFIFRKTRITMCFYNMFIIFLYLNSLSHFIHFFVQLFLLLLMSFVHYVLIIFLICALILKMRIIFLRKLLIEIMLEFHFFVMLLHFLQLFHALLFKSSMLTDHSPFLKFGARSN